MLCHLRIRSRISGGRRGNRGDVDSRTIFEFNLATSEDHLAAHDVGGLLDLDSVASKDLTEPAQRVMRDVLVLVSAGHQEAVDRFDNPPSDRRIVGRAEDKPATGPEHPVHLAENRLVEWNMFDDLRTDHAIERFRSE